MSLWISLVLAFVGTVTAFVVFGSLCWLGVASMTKSLCDMASFGSALKNLAASFGVPCEGSGCTFLDRWSQQYFIKVTYGKHGPATFSLWMPWSRETLGLPAAPEARVVSSEMLSHAVSKGLSWHLVLRKETGLDRYGKLLRLNKETQTGDQDFDPHVYIETEAPEHITATVLSDKQARSAILKILSAGFSEVRIYPGLAIEVHKDNPDTATLDPQLCHGCIALMNEVKNTLPGVSVPARRPPRLARGRATAIAAACLIPPALALLITAAWMWPTVDWDAYGVGFSLGFFSVLLSILPLGLNLRGRSDSFRHVIGTACALYLALPLLCAGGILLANGALDSSTGVRRHTSIDELYARDDTYHVSIRSWRAEGETLAYRIPQGTYERLARFRDGEEATHATITLHPGALGFLWWSSITPARAPAAPPPAPSAPQGV